MKKGIVVRLYPTKDQETLIIKTFGCARLIYNALLDYAKENKEYRRFELQKQITILRKDKPFLNEVDKFALQNVCKHLSDGLNNYFQERANFPIYRSKKKSKRTYQTNFTNGNIAFNDGYIKLPKLGLVKCSNNYRDSNNKIINVTISQHLDGKYYASIIYETNIPPLPKTGKEIGIDLGTRKLITTSEGRIYHLPNKAFKLEKRCRREHRKLSRRNKESKRYEKQRIILAKTYQRRKNIIDDNLHKFSSSLVKEYDVIYMEDLDLNQLLKIQDNKKKKNKMIISSLGKLVRMITYKANMYDKQIHKIDRYYASSQTCSCCQKRHNIDDKEKYICPYCGLEIDRDINAAINIRNKGKLSFS